MTAFLKRYKHHFIFKSTIWLMLMFFSVSLIAPQAAYARMAFMPAPGTLVNPSGIFTPAIMTGMRLDPADPLKIDFLVDIGDESLSDQSFQSESQKLINYFFAALTVPEDQMWVNLSPYEKDRIIAEPLSHTAMGRDMLAQDYLLKQLSASLMYPEEDLGREFWRRVHQKTQSEYGTTDIPLNTFNKIWIVPEQASVYVNDHHVFVSESRLKVLLEEDYLALEHHTAINENDSNGQDVVSGVSSEIVREILIPEIEKEINEGANFAPLRQMYHSLILASWYKINLKNSLLGQVYVGQNKIDGVEIAERDVKDKVYQQYIAAFKKGVFNYIKEDIDPASQNPIPRKYFSGGLDMAQLASDKLTEGLSPALVKQANSRSFRTVSTYAGLRGENGESILDQAMLVNSVEAMAGFLGVDQDAVAEAIGDALDANLVVDRWHAFAQRMGIDDGVRAEVGMILEDSLEEHGQPYDSVAITKAIFESKSNIADYLPRSKVNEARVEMAIQDRDLSADYPVGLMKSIFYLIVQSIDWDLFEDLIQADLPTDQQASVKTKIFGLSYSFGYTIDEDSKVPVNRIPFSSFEQFVDYFVWNQQPEFALTPGTVLEIRTTFDPNEVLRYNFAEFTGGSRLTGILSQSGNYVDGKIIDRIVVIQPKSTTVPDPVDSAMLSGMVVPADKMVQYNLSRPIKMDVVISNNGSDVVVTQQAGQKLYPEWSEKIQQQIENTLKAVDLDTELFSGSKSFKINVTVDSTERPGPRVTLRLPESPDGTLYVSNTNISSQAIILHPYFFDIEDQQQKNIIFTHEFVSRLLLGIEDEKEAYAHTSAILSDQGVGVGGLISDNEQTDRSAERIAAEALAFARDIRDQRNHRSGLSEALPNVSTQYQDVLLAVTQFLELTTVQSNNPFDGVSAREDLSQNPMIAESIVKYLRGDDNLEYIELLVAQTGSSALKRLLKDGIINITKTSADVVSAVAGDPVAVTFDGQKVTDDPHVKELVFTYKPGYFYAITQLVDHPDSDADAFQGGIRYKEPLKKTEDGFESSEEAAHELFKETYEEVDLISRSKYKRNVAAQTYAGGAKTVMVVHQGAESVKTELLQGFARSMVDVGLAAKYLVGMESGMTGRDQNVVSEAIQQRYLQHLQYELNRIKEHTGRENLADISADTYGGLLFDMENSSAENVHFLQDPVMDQLREHVSRFMYLGQQNGGTSLVKLFSSELRNDISRILGASATGGLVNREATSMQEWGLSAYSASISIETILEALPQLPDFSAVERKDTRIGIIGAVMGGEIALMLRRMGYTVVAIRDINGTVYKPEGFTLTELEELNSVNGNIRNVLQWMPEDNGSVQHLDNDALQKQQDLDLDVLISAARAETISESNIDSLRGVGDVEGRNPLVYIEAGFNSFEGLEDKLHERGILAFKATTVGLGGAYSTYLEDYLRHKFTPAELQKIIFRPADSEAADVVSGVDTVVNERVQVFNKTGKRLMGELVISGGKVLYSNIPDVVTGSSMEIVKDKLQSQGIDTNYRVGDLVRTVMWDNKTVVSNRDGIVTESNHTSMPVGSRFEYINPLNEFKNTAYFDIFGIAYRLNTMVMELVNRGLTPTQASERITNLLSDKKQRFESTDDPKVAEAISWIMQRLELGGFLFPSHIARKIAVKRLVGASHLDITLSGETFYFDAEGKLVPSEAAKSASEIDSVDMQAASRGSFSSALKNLEATRISQYPKDSDLGERFDVRDPSADQLSVVPEAAPQTVAPKKTAKGSIEERGIARTAGKPKASDSPAKQYIEDQRQQKMNRSGLDAVLPEVSAQQRDILLGVSQFLEMLSFYEVKHHDGEKFNGIEARAELVANPDIARAFLDYLNEEIGEAEVNDLLKKVDATWLEPMFERGIQSVKRTTAQTILRQDGDPIGIWFDGARLTEFPMKKVIVFIYSPGRFYGITQLVDISTAEDTKGGTRNSSPRGNNQEEIDDSAYKIFTGAYEDANNLSTSQYTKNVLAGLHFAGGKTVIGISQDALSLKDDHFRKWADSIVDILLMDNYVAGPDVGMSPQDMENIIAQITGRYTEHLKNEITLMRQNNVEVTKLKTLRAYGRELRKMEAEQGREFLSGALINAMRQRLMLALPRGGVNGSFIIEKVFNQNLTEEIQKIIGSGVTGGSSRVGALSHVALAVTGHGAVVSNMTQIEYMGIDPSKVRVVIVGAGDVGGSQALKYARRGYIVVGISDINGGVYKEEGFTVKELLDLNNIQPGDRNVLEWLPTGDGVKHIVARKASDNDDPNVIVGNIMDTELVPADLLVPAAMGGLINEDRIGANGETIPGTINMLPIPKNVLNAYLAEKGKSQEDADYQINWSNILPEDYESPTAANGQVPFMIDEGGNNGFIHLEELLHEFGIFGGGGAVNNPGGVQASTTEDLLKHKMTTRELREIVLRGDGKDIATDVNADVNEVITVYSADGTERVGQITLQNGFVVMSDIAEITLRANIDPIDGELFHRGDNLGYTVKEIKRQISWGNFRVLLNEAGRVLSSNHPSISFGEIIEFVDPLDQIKVDLYATIEDNIRRNKVMIMELYTKKDLNPTQASVVLANARGNRKAEIYEAPDNSALGRERDQVVRRLRKEGYMMAEHVARNIAAMEVALQGELTVVVADEHLTFGPQGKIINSVKLDDQAMTAEQLYSNIAMETLNQMGLNQQPWIEQMIFTLNRSSQGLFAFKKPKADSKLDRMVFYAIDKAVYDASDSIQADFEQVKQFVQTFVNRYNQFSQVKYKVDVKIGERLFVRADAESEWADSLHYSISIQPSGGFLSIRKMLSRLIMNDEAGILSAEISKALAMHRVILAISQRALTAVSISSDQVAIFQDWFSNHKAYGSDIEFLALVYQSHTNDQIKQQAGNAIISIYSTLDGESREALKGFMQSKKIANANGIVPETWQGFLTAFDQVTDSAGENTFADSAMISRRAFVTGSTIIGGLITAGLWKLGVFSSDEVVAQYGDSVLRNDLTVADKSSEAWEDVRAFLWDAMDHPSISDSRTYISHVSNFQRAANQQVMILSGGNVGFAGTQFDELNQRLNVRVGINIDLMNQLRELAQDIPEFNILAYGAVIKEGAHVSDIVANPDRQILYHYFSNNRNKLSDDEVLDYVAHMTRLEAIGFEELVNYLNDSFDDPMATLVQMLRHSLDKDNQLVARYVAALIQYIRSSQVTSGPRGTNQVSDARLGLYAQTYSQLVSHVIDSNITDRLDQVLAERGVSARNFTAVVQDSKIWETPEVLNSMAFFFNPELDEPLVYFNTHDFDPAMLALLNSDTDTNTKGGIDFNAGNMNLEIKGDRFEFEMTPAQLEQINPATIKGVVPVIINITPLPNLFPLLGLNADGTDRIVDSNDDSYVDESIEVLGLREKSTREKLLAAIR